MGAGDRFAPARLALGRLVWGLTPHPAEPLLSIVIPTWNRAEFLTTRTLPSVLRQTYRNWEVVVVGDACTDDTGARIAALDEPRIRFLNLAERGTYPPDPLQRWMVAGSTPANRALALARGQWSVTLDDDDVLAEDHLETLPEFRASDGSRVRLRVRRLPTLADGMAADRETASQPGNVMHSSVLYRSYRKFLRYDLEAWKVSICADAHLWGRMYALGVRFAHLDRVVCQAPLRPGENLAGQKAAERRQETHRAESGTQSSA